MLNVMRATGKSEVGLRHASINKQLLDLNSNGCQKYGNWPVTHKQNTAKSQPQYLC